MKILALMAAGLIGAAALTPVAASAGGQQVVRHRVVVNHHNARRDRWRVKTVCTNRLRNGHRSRVCRKVRTRW